MGDIHLKEILTLLSIALIWIGYTPYIRDILRGKTHPHLFSWLIWSILNFCLFWLQLNAWAGFASWIILILWITSLLVFILWYKYGERDIRKIDIFFLISSLLAIPIWLFLDQPLFSTILLTWIGISAFAPTIRKTWANPYSETVITYYITTVRHVLNIFALSQYNFITIIFPWIWIFINISFLLMIWFRRRKWKQ